MLGHLKEAVRTEEEFWVFTKNSWHILEPFESPTCSSHLTTNRPPRKACSTRKPGQCCACSGNSLRLGSNKKTITNIMFLSHSIFLFTSPPRSHFDASVRPTPDSTGGGELFEKFQLKQKNIKDNTTVGGQMGGKR